MKISYVFLILAAMLFACQPPSSSDTEEASIREKPIPYSEEHRPQFHFSPEKMWMNDPNGMVFYKGEYHLFYQYYPEDIVWGPMHWGHAVSKDLFHWEHLPIGLYPDELGYIFSGSAVMDHNNTAGFKDGDEIPMIAIFTHHEPKGEKEGALDFQYQSIAYSNDRGRKWTKYEGNPVIPNPGIKDFRDPKVFWHEDSEKWVMIFASGDRVQIYTSPNLKDWELGSEFGEDQGNHGGVWECPDLFELPIDGNPENTKWMMIVSMNPGNPNGGSGTQYFVGDFDGKTFTNDNPKEMELWMDYGRDNYAGVTWADIPESDGRRIFIGWMSNWEYAQKVPTKVWRSAMTVPRVLSFRTTENGIRLNTQVAKEIKNIRGKSHSLKTTRLKADLDISSMTGGQSLFEVEVELAPAGDGIEQVGLLLSNDKGESLLAGYDVRSNEYFIDRNASGKEGFHKNFEGVHAGRRIVSDDILHMHFVVDVASIEMFADNGSAVLTDIFFPNGVYTSAKLIAKGGDVELISGTVTELKGSM